MRPKSLFFILMMLCTPALVFAAPNYYANIGMSKPFAPEPFRNDWRSGFNLGAGIGFNVSPKFEIQGEVLYDFFQLDDNSYLKNITDNIAYASVSGGETSILTLSANFKYFSPISDDARVTPFLVGTVGAASKIISEKNINTEERQYTETKESNTIPAFGAGLGVEIEMGGNTYFVIEGRFNVLLTEETTVYMPLKLGIVIR